MKLRCASCGKSFEAQRRTAKYCSPPCRLRAHRAAAGKTAEKKPPTTKRSPKRVAKRPAKKTVAKAVSTKSTTKKTPAKKTPAKKTPAKKTGTRIPRAAVHRLVASVRRELEQRQVVNTVMGQQALELARRLADPEETGASALSRELRVVMASIAHTAAKPDDDKSDGEPDDDEVTRARKARAQARQAAGLT